MSEFRCIFLTTLEAAAIFTRRAHAYRGVKRQVTRIPAIRMCKIEATYISSRSRIVNASRFVRPLSSVYVCVNFAFAHRRPLSDRNFQIRPAVTTPAMQRWITYSIYYRSIVRKRTLLRYARTNYLQHAWFLFRVAREEKMVFNFAPFFPLFLFLFLFYFILLHRVEHKKREEMVLLNPTAIQIYRINSIVLGNLRIRYT